MELSSSDLDRVRDYVGSTPDDTTIYTHAETATYWQDIALRILKRRRADAAAGGQQTTSFGLDGVFTVGMSKADLGSLDTQIAALQAELAALSSDAPAGVSVGVIRRTDRPR